MCVCVCVYNYDITQSLTNTHTLRVHPEMLGEKDFEESQTQDMEGRLRPRTLTQSLSVPSKDGSTSSQTGHVSHRVPGTRFL